MLVQMLVIGGGPGGQKAAVQAAKGGWSVLLVERELALGGECVHRGTIPSKTLRESARTWSRWKRLEGREANARAELPVAQLMRRQAEVRKGHESFLARQLARNGIEVWRGHARFVSPHEVEVKSPDGSLRRVRASTIVIATGSRPRHPAEVPIDHEHVLDSDSILSLIYLPESLTVLGSGVIACEYASIFAALGVRVTVIDKGERPLGFLERELTERFLASFERQGGRFLGKRTLEGVEVDPLGGVRAELAGGETVTSEKVFCALGRVAQVRGLALEAAGLAPNARGLLEVDRHGRTAVPHVYAVGDVIGPPALAATSMEQGRRAARHALGLAEATACEFTPIGIYTLPEISSVGWTEREAIERLGGARVGRARFEELARGEIEGERDGLLKLVADPDGRKLVGAQAVGEGANELIHVAQMALEAGLGVDAFADSIFNFPTLAEGYLVAALDLVGQRAKALRAAG